MIVKYVIMVVILFCTVNIASQAADQPKPRDLDQEIIKCQNTACFNELGFAYYRLHRIPEAMNAYSMAITLDPGYPLAYNNVGVCYLHLKDYIKAEDAFNTALTLDPYYVKAAYNLSVALFWQKKYYNALKAYQQAYTINAAYVRKRLKDSKAIKKIKQELKRDPNLLRYRKKGGAYQK